MNTLGKLLKKMTNNKQQTSLEWFAERIQSDKIFNFEKVLQQAKERYSDEIEAAAIKQCATSATSAASANTEAFADGYRQGYNRALELSKWAISNLVPPHNEKK